MEWFRMYHGVLNDPKVHRLTIARRWRWVEVLCIASQHGQGLTRTSDNSQISESPRSDNSHTSQTSRLVRKEKIRGQLPSVDDIAFFMRVKRDEATSILNDLIRVGLVDELPNGQGLAVHEWDEHQKPSDSSTARVAGWRKNQANKACNVTDPLPVTGRQQSVTDRAHARDSDSEREKEKTALLGSPALPERPPRGAGRTTSAKQERPVDEERREMEERARRNGPA